MWKVYIASGSILDAEGHFVGPMYSGHGDGVNKPSVEDVPGVGPIPCGLWHIVKWLDRYENKGPVVAKLEPVGHNAHGRSGFLIHGDNAKGDHSASHGCIIASRAIREKWRTSGDCYVKVIGGTRDEEIA